MTTMVTLEEAFHLYSVFKFKIIAGLTDYQEFAIRKTVVMKGDTTIFELP